MRVVEPGNDAPSLEVDGLGRRAAQRQNLIVVTHGDDAAALDRQRLGLWLGGIERGDFATVQNKLWHHLNSP